MIRRNEEVAHLLDSIAELLSIKGENPFRIRAYTEAARNIRALSENIDDVHHADRLDDIPGVGEAIAKKLAEYLDTGRLGYYEDLKRQVNLAAVDLLEVPGIGPARAHQFYEALGITSIQELEEAALAHRLRTLPGMGPALEEKIAREAARAVGRGRRMLLGVALPVAEEITSHLRAHPAVEAVSPAGSIRRVKETIGDIDLLAASSRLAEVVEAFTTLPLVKEVLSKGPTRPSILTRDDLQIDLRVVAPEEYGSALQYFTGSKEHNIALRSIALERGWKLSEYGLFDQEGRRVAGRTEEEIYQALGLDWVPPELRENRGEIEAARRHALPVLVTLDAIHGDLHVHTNWSDGHDAPERMVEAAISRGYEYLAFADHSGSLRVARGLAPDRVRQQHQLIEELNARYAPFRILHGAEVNILPDGSLDYPDEVLRLFDVVTVSVHSALNQPRDQMTARMIRALAHPLVDILGHPTGRLLSRRSEYEVDMDAILRAAVEHRVALEVNGQPDRLDLSDVWARRASDSGALLVCSSDAHSAAQLEYVGYAVATARRGWVGPGAVLNARALSGLLRHLADRRRRRGQAAAI